MNGVIEQFGNESKLYGTNETSCNCNYRFQMGTQCKHIIFLRKSRNLPIFVLESFSNVFFDSFMKGGCHVSEDDYERHFANLQLFELEQTPTCRSSKTYSSTPARYKEIREYTDTCAELIAASPGSLHTEKNNPLNNCFPLRGFLKTHFLDNSLMGKSLYEYNIVVI